MPHHGIQNVISDKKRALINHRLELTHDQGFVDGARDIFDILANKNAPQEKSEKAAHTPLPQHITDLLRTAYQAIEKAEDTISNQNARIKALEGLLTTDELTGLCNRRGLLDALARESDRMTRGQSSGGLLIMIDLDLFKDINDTHGHAAGDAALRKVAAFLLEHVRDMDVAARLGGDEFVLLLPNATKSMIFNRATQIRKGLNALSFAFDGKTIPVRASLGLKDYIPGCNIDHILHAADQDLYADKNRRKQNTTH